MLIPDEGYYFGIGAFETIAVENGTPVFLEQHCDRLQRAMDFFAIKTPMQRIMQQVEQTLEEPDLRQGRKVLKITVSPENLLVTSRKNTYRREDYERGFTAEFSEVRRNETSPLTYHKTLNYGDCILEKRRAKSRGIDEPVFMNLKGEIAEGACTNVFFVKKGRVVTPSVASGLLPGILRSYICNICGAEERTVLPEEIQECEEMFLTNSLMGVMPVTAFGAYRFPSRDKSRELLAQYWRLCGGAAE
ncbi:MAG: aminotransferase class IV [Lachnospiraceae bacterium]|nr:aminotransferase class IV [Lachnospiraceae bacterium]